jgi:uncharacterized protein (DUF2147 family)
MKAVMLATMLVGTLAGAASAEDANGVWLRDSGNARIRVAACGGALCGTLVWVKDPNGPGKVGQRVLIDMKPAGSNEWRGTAFNPEDGKTYTGTMSLAGNQLTTAGCALGGLICKSVSWQRVN